MNEADRSRRHIVRLSLLAAFAGAQLAGAAAQPSMPPIATVSLDGTLLSVTTATAYERALLRVSGPEGYALFRWFPADTPIVVDLSTDGAVTGFVAGPWDEAGASAVLPEGRYRHEVVLTSGSGDRRSHSGHFYVDNGVPLTSEARHQRRAAVPSDSGRETEAPASAGEGALGGNQFIDDFVQISDTAFDGSTYIRIEAFDAPNEDTWVLLNDEGELSFREDATDTRLQFIDGGKVGVGTTAPLAQLHVVGAQPQLILDDNAGNSHFVIQNANGLFIGRPGPLIELFISSSAPAASLVLEGTGVGIGVLTPTAKLHVNGSTLIEGDVALGSSREVKDHLERLDSDSVLDAVRDLDLYTWEYKDDADRVTHAGPMAEDMHGLFGLGRDPAHLSPADTAGLALAAIQGIDGRLDRELDGLRSANARLAARNLDLRLRLAAVEERIDALVAEATRARSSPGPTPCGLR